MKPDVKFPILLFDGVCNLCNGAVQWVLRRDRAGRFRFASLQSETGRDLLRRAGLPADAIDTVVLIVGDRAYTRSDAVLEISRHLEGAWHLFRVFAVVPRPWRNGLYDWVARHRYRWFGREETCWLPRPEWRERFL